MSKLTRKCPNCGATVPADVKYCRKCHTRMDSGRVEVLEQKPAKEQQPSRPRKRARDDDALRNLPKPVRPAELSERMNAVQNGDRRAFQQAGQNARQMEEEEGFFSPEQPAAVRPERPARRGRRAPAGEDVPRPMSTARGVDGQPVPEREQERNKSLLQIIVVLAIILVIIIVAIVLVIRLNRPASGIEASDPYENANIITSSTAAPSPSPTPITAVTPEVLPPDAGLVVPDATPVPAPSATPIISTPLPSPSATPAPNYTVTPVNDTVYINGNGVNIRSGPGTDHSVIGSESTGKQLQRTGRTSNGWSQISYNGQTGYVIDSLITTTQPATNTASGVTPASGTVKVTAASGANLRTGPGTNYSVAYTVAVNTELTRTGTSGSWTQVSYGGQTLYISTSLLDGGSASGSGDGSGVTADSGSVTVTGNGVRIRSGPGTGYSQIGTVNSGNVLTVTGKSGDWYQVSFNGQTGYISATYARKN